MQLLIRTKLEPVFKKIVQAAGVIVLALAISGCGSSGTGGGGGVPGGGDMVPPPQGRFCLSPGGANRVNGNNLITLTLVCPLGSAGVDHQCTFFFQSANTAVVSITQSLFFVPENQTRVFFVQNFAAVGTTNITGRNQNGDLFNFEVTVSGSC